MSKALLRTKSGCLTCRKRRVKCDENKPLCRQCSSARRLCTWPTPADFSDGRNRRQPQRKDPKANCEGFCVSKVVEFSDDEDLPIAPWSVLSAPMSKTTISSNVEFTLLLHYQHQFIAHLLLPTLPPALVDDYRSNMMHDLLSAQGLKCAVMSACASNRYTATRELRYLTLADTYHTQASQHVMKSITSLIGCGACPGDALISSVIFLYISSLWGPGDSSDALQHVAGAQQLLKLRYTFKKPLFHTLRNYDRIIIESVAYQSCLLIMRRPFSLDDPLNRRFLDNTFEFLDFLASEQESEISRSRVLGVPPALYSLILRIACRKLTTKELQDPYCESSLRESVQQWHGRLTTMSIGTNSSSPSMTDLYILAASLLYDLHDHDMSLVAMGYTRRMNMPSFTKLPLQSAKEPSIGTRWQVELALSYLRHPELRQNCIVCYLSTWPLFIFGSVVDKPEDIDFIRQLLRDAQRVTGYGELERIEHELEQGWMRFDPISAMSSSTSGTVESLLHSRLQYSDLS